MKVRTLLFAVVCVVLVGCGSSQPAPAEAPKDPLAGLSPQEQIDKLQQDQHMNSMERETKIAEIKAKNGLK